jgi:hypothetical protein
MASLTSDLPGRLGIPQITMVGNVCNHGSGLGILYQVSPAAETHARARVKCLLLMSELNENWNVLTNFSKTVQYQMLQK